MRSVLRSNAGAATRRRPAEACAARAALRAGVGIDGCRDAIARRTPELIPVLPNAFQMALEVWLVMHRDLKTAPRVRLMFDWLVGGLTDYVRGRRPERDASLVIPGGPKV